MFAECGVSPSLPGAPAAFGCPCRRSIAILTHLGRGEIEGERERERESERRDVDKEIRGKSERRAQYNCGGQWSWLTRKLGSAEVEL